MFYDAQGTRGQFYLELEITIRNTHNVKYNYYFDIFSIIQ